MRLTFAIISFTKRFFIENPVKLITLLIAIVLLSISYNIKELEVTNNKLVLSKKDGTNFFKVYTKNNGIDYTLEYDNKIPKSYKSYKHSDVYFMTFVFGMISLIFFVIAFLAAMFSDDKDSSWTLDTCFSEFIECFIICDLEDGKYHYTIFGRLIDITDKQITSSINYKYNINEYSKILKLPKFSTTSKNRNDKLNKLGIK